MSKSKQVKTRRVLTREDFIFTIGYDGPAAVVDSQARRRYGSLSTAALLDKGLFRAAYSSAVYSGDAGEKEAVVKAYNQAAGTSYSVSASLDRLFGVFPVDVRRIILI
ncbi:hypothetical protein AGMMS49928_27270 [Spirochaetia bacterium]|nr:hypothetical protein AGMMS49928_27270 [Spirochaetia bacterium]